MEELKRNETGKRQDWPVTEDAFWGYRGNEETVTPEEAEMMADIQKGRK